MRNYLEKLIDTFHGRVLRNQPFLMDAEHEAAVYVLDFGTCIKIGRADDLKRRMQDYASPHCRTVISYKYYYAQDVRLYEKFLLNRFRLHPRSGEYLYDTPFKDVTDIADLIMATKVSILIKTER